MNYEAHPVDCQDKRSFFVIFNLHLNRSNIYSSDSLLGQLEDGLTEEEMGIVEEMGTPDQSNYQWKATKQEEKKKELKEELEKLASEVKADIEKNDV